MYNLLADMGIYADIKIMDWQSDEHYTSLDDAVAEWKEMRELPDEKSLSCEFLSMKLVRDDEGYACTAITSRL